MRDLFVKSVTGAGADEKLLETDVDKIPYSWSPDGRFILYQTSERPGGNSEIWALPMAGELKPILFLRSKFNDAQPRFSQDGKWVVYVSNESGLQEVYATLFPGPGRMWQISAGGGGAPLWRRDGKEILYESLDGKLIAVPVSVRGDTLDVVAPKVLLDLQSAGGWAYSTLDGQRFLISMSAEAERASPLVLVTNWPSALQKK